MIKLLLVDNEPAVRKGLRMRLGSEPDMVVVGEAINGKDALTLAQKLRPDVVVMDVKMPHMDGIAATQALGAVCPRPAVIMLTIHDDDATRTRARAAGAVALIAKSGSADELLEAIRQAARSQKSSCA